MKGDEARVVDAFCAWLAAEGWSVRRSGVDHVDVVAERQGLTLYAEAKGRTTEPGTDVDTMYGQLLRRMPEKPSGRERFAVVAPASARWHVERVPRRVRELLGIAIYLVDDASAVVEVEA